MFLRKFFQVSDKAKWIVLELLIVFIGVYMAFLFQSFAEEAKIEAEKTKVLMSLKGELEEFRINFPRFANYQEGKTKEWDSLLNIRKYDDFYSWRYLEPQYNFKVIEYAMEQKGTEIVSFEMYEELSKIYSFIKRLEHAERRMTEFADKYVLISTSHDESSSEYKDLQNENIINFYRFNRAAKDRFEDLRLVGQLASQVLVDINKELGPEKQREAEFNLFKRYYESQLLIEGKTDFDFLLEIASEHFPAYTSEELTNYLSGLRESLN